VGAEIKGCVEAVAAGWTLGHGDRPAADFPLHGLAGVTALA
jgi:hypothetical protein